jgi:LacI family trehalose operon transcriptional repressor
VQALEHLNSQKVSNIAFIGVDPSDKTTGKVRLEAYLNWCHEQQIEPNYQTGHLHHESAYQLVDKVLRERTDAIVCASDTLALGVIKRLQELDREDIIVTGVGGNELLSFLFPKVFSIDPGYAQAGQRAANLLISQVNGEISQVHITQQPVLI